MTPDSMDWEALRARALELARLAGDTHGATPDSVSYTHLTLPTNREV